MWNRVHGCGVRPGGESRKKASARTAPLAVCLLALLTGAWSSPAPVERAYLIDHRPREVRGSLPAPPQSAGMTHRNCRHRPPLSRVVPLSDVTRGDGGGYFSPSSLVLLPLDAVEGIAHGETARAIILDNLNYMQFPFTVPELQRALELVMSAEEAARLADSSSSTWEVFHDHFVGHGITGDTLILLSLLSDDLRRRVDEYLKLLGSGLQEGVWSARRLEIETALQSVGRLPKP